MSSSTRPIRLPEDAPTRVKAAVASMSASWHVGEASDAVTVVVGDGQAGDAGVLLVDPLGTATDVPPPVVVELGWNHDPAATAAAAEFSRLLDGDALVETAVVLAVSTPLEQSLLAQLALLRTVVGAVGELRLIRADRAGYDVLGRLRSGAGVAITAMFSDALPSSASVRLVKPLESIELTLSGPGIASPGAVRVTHQDGVRSLPSSWETSSRAALRVLHDALETGTPFTELPGLLDDIELVSMVAKCRGF